MGERLLGAPRGHPSARDPCYSDPTRHSKRNQRRQHVASHLRFDALLHYVLVVEPQSDARRGLLLTSAI